MITIRRLLCPVDFSDHSRRALDHAWAIAQSHHAAVTVLHVAPLAPVAAYAPMSGLPAYVGLTPDARQVLIRSLEAFAADGPSRVPVEVEIAEGQPAAVIVDRAHELAAELIVLGTHGRSGFERWVLGSVTERVLRQARCPVLTVPPRAPESAAEPVAFKHIVCAVDFSDCAMHALDYAISLADEARASLTVVHVIELPPDIPREVHETVMLGPRDRRGYLALAEAEAQARLTDAVDGRVCGEQPIATVLRAGKPYREILRVAQEQSADLLVVGVHGRGAIDRMFFGSTTQHLVRQAACPVLTIRTDQPAEGEGT
jgi:nucleotide-binding universal stress UspA family protein